MSSEGSEHQAQLEGEGLLRDEYASVWGALNPGQPTAWIYGTGSQCDSQEGESPSASPGGASFQAANLRASPGSAASAVPRSAKRARKSSLLDEAIQSDLPDPQAYDRDEVTRYMALRYTPKSGEGPNDFWKERQREFPVLTLLARKYHCIDSTSCEPERIFSRAGFLMNEYRTCMMPWKVESYMFLHMNQHLHPEFIKLQSMGLL